MRSWNITKKACKQCKSADKAVAIKCCWRYSSTDCAEVTAESVNIPQFIRIDFDSMKLTSPEGSEVKRDSMINDVQQSNGSILLQGIGHGRAWSIAISEESGKMTGTVSEDEGGFVVFGACVLD